MPPRIKNQHGLIPYLSANDVTHVASLGSNNLSVRDCESGKSCVYLDCLIFTCYLDLLKWFYSPDIHPFYFVSALCWASVRLRSHIELRCD